MKTRIKLTVAIKAELPDGRKSEFSVPFSGDLGFNSMQKLAEGAVIGILWNVRDWLDKEGEDL